MAKRRPAKPSKRDGKRGGVVTRLPVLAKRWVAIPSSNYTDSQAQVIGEELARIAEENNVDDVRSLDERLVYGSVKRDVKAGRPNRLKAFYNWDDEVEADKRRLEVTKLMIRCIRPVRIDNVAGLNRTLSELPAYTSITLPPGRREATTAAGKQLRKRVLTPDVMKSDPLFANAIGRKIREVRRTVADFSSYVRAKEGAPPEMVELADALERALEDYEALVLEKAS